MIVRHNNSSEPEDSKALVSTLEALPTAAICLYAVEHDPTLTNSSPGHTNSPCLAALVTLRAHPVIPEATLIFDGDFLTPIRKTVFVDFVLHAAIKRGGVQFVDQRIKPTAQLDPKGAYTQLEALRSAGAVLLDETTRGRLEQLLGYPYL